MTRQTIPVPRYASPFEHRTIVELRAGLLALPNDPHPVRSAVCRTDFPATRCECALFDLEWV